MCFEIEFLFNIYNSSPFHGAYVNNADPDQTQHNALSVQGHQFAHIIFFLPPNTPKYGNGFVLLNRVGKFVLYKHVKWVTALYH